MHHLIVLTYLRIKKLKKKKKIKNKIIKNHTNYTEI